MTEDPSVKRFHYGARVLRVVDGDTADLELDLGLSIKRTERLRLHGINTPEIVGAERAAGMAAKEALEGLLRAGPECVVQTFKDADDKFGRLLARIYVWGSSGWICVNDEMISAGFARPWDGKGARP